MLTRQQTRRQVRQGRHQGLPGVRRQAHLRRRRLLQPGPPAVRVRRGAWPAGPRQHRAAGRLQVLPAAARGPGAARELAAAGEPGVLRGRGPRGEPGPLGRGADQLEGLCRAEQGEVAVVAGSSGSWTGNRPFSWRVIAYDMWCLGLWERKAMKLTSCVTG